MNQPVPNTPRKSAPGHGGYRPGAGRKAKTEQNDAYTILAKAKAKRETYNAQIAELEYKQRSGELLHRDDVLAEWTRHIAVAKGRLMALPSRVSTEIAQESDVRVIEEVIRAALFDVLDELACDDGGSNAD